MKFVWKAVVMCYNMYIKHILYPHCAKTTPMTAWPHPLQHDHTHHYMPAQFFLHVVHLCLDYKEDGHLYLHVLVTTRTCILPPWALVLLPWPPPSGASGGSFHLRQSQRCRVCKRTRWSGRFDEAWHGPNHRMREKEKGLQGHCKGKRGERCNYSFLDKF